MEKFEFVDVNLLRDFSAGEKNEDDVVFDPLGDDIKPNIEPEHLLVTSSSVVKKEMVAEEEEEIWEAAVDTLVDRGPSVAGIKKEIDDVLVQEELIIKEVFEEEEKEKMEWLAFDEQYGNKDDQYFRKQPGVDQNEKEVSFCKSLYSVSWVCTVCGQGFSSRSSLDHHKAEIHSTSPTLAQILIEEMGSTCKDGPVCNRCNKSFSRKGSMRTTRKSTNTSQESRLTGRNHWPVQLPNSRRRRCVVCSSHKTYQQSRFTCMSCNVGLCMNKDCFKDYHTKADY